jgi:hypothetical protein
VIYPLSLVLHVVSAVLMLGPVLALALGSQDARLARIASIGLVVMFVTGLGMLAVTQWAFVHTLWIRASGVLFILMGAALGNLRGALRKGNAAQARNVAWAVVAMTAVVTALMELKP